MERLYFLTKDTTVFSLIYDIQIIRSVLDWYCISLSKPQEETFKSSVKGKYYSVDPLVGAQGFLTFADIRSDIKVLKQTYDDGSIAIQSEGIAISSSIAPGDQVVSAEKIKIAMTAERTKAVMDAMILLAKAVIEEEYDRRFMLLDTSSHMESFTFELQYEEAKAYKENSNADIPLLKALSEAKELSIDEMVNKVLNARNIFKQSVTELFKSMSELKGKFKNAGSIRDLNRLYEDYFAIGMPETQAVEEGRVVDFKRVIPILPGFKF